MSQTTKILNTPKGETLAVYEWLYTRRDKPRAAVLLVPTLSDYGLRHERLATRLLNWGFMVRSFDFYGHGMSSGIESHIPHMEQLTDDLSQVVADWKKTLPADMPLVIWGLTMGSTVAAHAQLTGKMDADAYCMVSPALGVNMTFFQTLLLYVVRYLIPNQKGTNHFDPQEFTRDPQAQLVMQHDPKWKRTISIRLADYVFTASKYVHSQAEHWNKRTLLLYGTAKTGVDTSATEDFVTRAGNTLEVKKFDDMTLDLFNDLGKEQVYTRLQQWLDKLYPVK